MEVLPQPQPDANGIVGGVAMDEDNPFLQNNDEQAAEEAQKKAKQTRFKITSEDLTQGPMGLN